MNQKQVKAITDPLHARISDLEIMLQSVVGGETTRHQHKGWILLYRPSPRSPEVWEQGRAALLWKEDGRTSLVSIGLMDDLQRSANADATLGLRYEVRDLVDMHRRQYHKHDSLVLA